MRAKKSLWPQIEATFKQMDIAATELECFEVLQKQEQLAASHRINNLQGEVQKQKELERTLQNRYGSLMEELEKIQNIMDQYRVQAQQQEEIEANNHAHELTETVADETDVQDTENSKAVPLSVENGTAIAADPSHDETANQQVGIVPDHTAANAKNDMDVDSNIKQTTQDPNAKSPDAAPAAEDDTGKVEGNSTDGNVDNGENTLDKGAVVQTSSNEANREDQDVVMDAVNSHDDSIQEKTAASDEGDKMQVADGQGDGTN